MNTFNEDLQKQVDEIKAMIYKNVQLITFHYKAPFEERTLTHEQLMKLIDRTKILAQCLDDVQKLEKL